MSILISALIVVAAMVTFVLFYTASYHKKRARMLDKVPVSPIREIDEEGVVKVVGRVAALDNVLTSPMTKTKCVFYRLHVEQQIPHQEVASNYGRRKVADDDEDDGEWATVVEDVRTVLFAVEDDTGTADVEAANLDIDVKLRKRIDSGRLKSLSESQEKMLNERYPDKTFSYTKKMRYTEVVIEEGDELMVTGEVDLPKGRNPCFSGGDDSPIHLSDRTENKAADESRKSAKTNTLFSGISGVCTLGLVAWLVVNLTTGKSSSSSSSSGPRSTSDTSTDVAKNKIDPVVGKKNPFDQVAKNDPKSEFINDPKSEAPPRKEEAKDDLPRGRDADSVIVRAKAKLERNDVAGAQAEFRNLIDIADPDHPKKSQVVGFLTGYLHDARREYNEPSRIAYLKWQGPKDVVAVCKLLSDEPDANFQRDILKKLAEWKAPSSAITVAAFLKSKQTEGEAANALKAIGPDAEKALLPLIKPPTDPALRVTAMKLLEILGAVDSVTALEEVILDKDKRIADQARASLAKVTMRTGTTRTVESILALLKVKAIENDIAGIKQAIADLKTAAKDDAKKSQAATALLDSSLVAMDVNSKRDMLSQAPLWCSKEQLPSLLTVLRAAKDDDSVGNILKRLQDFKDPRAAAPVAALLKDLKHRARAVDLLKALGDEAESAVIPMTKPENDAKTRVAAMQVLEMIGTKDSIAALEGYLSDENKEVSVAANRIVGVLTTKTGTARSLDVILATLKTQAVGNDLNGARRTLKNIADNYKPDHPKRAETFKTLFEISQNAQQFFIKDETFKQALRWSASEDVPTLIKMLPEPVDDKFDAAKDGQINAVFDKLKELKDPRCAEVVARFLLNFFKREKAAEVLKAIGPPAEKAVQPFIKETGPDAKPIKWPERKFVIELLGEMGSSDSLTALQQQTRDKLVFIKDAARTAMKKIEERKDKK